MEFSVFVEFLEVTFFRLETVGCAVKAHGVRKGTTMSARSCETFGSEKETVCGV